MCKPCAFYNFLCREHDKDPETFFSVIEELKRENLPFRLSVLGETFETVPGSYILLTFILIHS